jgi:hypothetical protein
MIERFGKECFFYKTSVPRHEELKPYILNDILLLGKNSYTEKVSKISNTDWNLPAEFHRQYMTNVYPLFVNHFDEIKNTYGWWYNQRLVNFWFQQYEPGDYHGWHIHHSVLFSSVYYVELPDGGATQFKTPQGTFTIPVKEGEILTFPSFFFHQSAPNKTKQRKTIIATNWDAVEWSDDVLK